MRTERRLFGKMNPAILVIMAVGFLFVAMNAIKLVALADSAAKVTATTANIRKEPNASSAALGSVKSGEAVTITGQTTGADNNIWYQVVVNADSKGFIRSDLVSITDGSTPATITVATTTETTSTGDPVSTTGVTQVNPVSATVAGGQSVRVRADASTSSSIVTTAANGLALTVNGTKNDGDGKTWYYVSFINNGASTTGFIRSDFVSLSGEVTPYTEETEQPTEGSEEMPEQEPVVEESKTYETQLQGDDWYLINNDEGMQYNIRKIFSDLQANADLYEKEHKKAKTNRNMMIIFMVVAIAALGAAAFFLLKWRECEDQQAMVDAERKQRSRTGNPSGDRPARPNGTRPAQGQRPSGTRPAGTRPAQGGTRPAGERPSGTRPAGTRPAQGGTRPVQTAVTPEGGVRSPRAAENGVRPAGTRPAAAPRPRPADDDDEFEFGFLNWDGDDDK